jgi:hypothetical protein
VLLLLLLLQIVGAIFGSLLAAALVPEAHIGEAQHHALDATMLLLLLRLLALRVHDASLMQCRT